MSKPLKGTDYFTFIHGDMILIDKTMEKMISSPEWQNEFLQSMREANEITNELERLRKIDNKLLQEPMTI
jgi:hypothetical protein